MLMLLCCLRLVLRTNAQKINIIGSPNFIYLKLWLLVLYELGEKFSLSRKFYFCFYEQEWFRILSECSKILLKTSSFSLPGFIRYFFTFICPLLTKVVSLSFRKLKNFAENELMKPSRLHSLLFYSYMSFIDWGIFRFLTESSKILLKTSSFRLQASFALYFSRFL